MICFKLPWPPSVNTYWRSVNNRVLISKEGRQYRDDVSMQLGGATPLAGRIACVVEAFPPDRRRRDLDNLCKATLDALEAAGVYENDSQIDDLRVVRREPCKGGKILVSLDVLAELA